MSAQRIRKALIAEGVIAETDFTIRNIEYHFTNCLGAEAGKLNREILERIAQLVATSGIDLADVGKIERIVLDDRKYEMLTKDNDGNAHVHPLKAGGSRIVISPSWDTGPKWPVVQPAVPVKLPTRTKAVRTTAVRKDGWKTALILPDVQIGYHRDLHAPWGLTPFHDEAAMDVALQVCEQVQPDLIVNLGDFLDFAEFSRFLKEPSFALTTQAAIDRGHLFLAEQRAIAPLAEIRLLQGNHDLRIDTHIKANAVAAFGIKQANLPDSWPVMSVQHLLRLDDLSVTYVDGYPAGITWINERLACVHGSKVRSGGSTAAAVIDDERVSVIFGHVHRIEQQFKTRRTYDGPRTNFAASCGCLCRTDGTVPSVKGGTDAAGRVVQATEDWQNGIAVVTYQDGDAPFAYEPVFINQGSAIFRGEQILARTNSEHAA